MNLTNYLNTIETGMNNPDCAYFVGASQGNMLGGYEIIFLLFILFLFKLVSNITQLGWDNMIRYIKNKIKK